VAEQIQLPVLLSLLPKVGKMIQAEQDRPAMQQALTASLMQEAMRRERQQVQELKKTQESAQLRSEDGKDRGSSGDHPRHQRHQAKPDEEPPESTDPWSGQIVNITI
jgi:hypothetical protein